MVELTVHTFSHHCLADGTCHCDWRVTLQGCVEQRAMTGVYIGNIALCALVFVVGVALLVHRIGFKGHRLFDASPAKGCLRPKPIDCMLALLMVFNLLRLLTSVILIADVAPDMVSRMFLFEFPWQFGYGAFALYLIGIAQTLADSHKAISNGWLPSPRTVDAVGCTFFFAPFIANNIVALIGGAMAETNLYIAEICVRILYVFWFIHCFFLALAVLLSGIKLVRILNVHLAKIQSSCPRYTSVKTGIFKIRAVMGIIVTCLMMFAAFLLLYGILRDQIMVNKPGSIFLGVIWTYLGSLTTLFVEIAVIFNPKIGNAGIGGLKTSSNSGGKSGSGEQDTQQSSYVISGMDASFQATTMSQNTVDDLKQQQIQYEQVFQKHNQRSQFMGIPTAFHTTTADTVTGHPSYDNGTVSPIGSIRGAIGTEKIALDELHWPPPTERLPEDPHDDLSSQVQLLRAER